MGQLSLSAPKHFSSCPEVEIPASKSISNRLLIIRALANEQIVIQNLSRANDTVLLETFLNAKSEEKWAGDAGTVMRFGTAWAAATPGRHILAGTARMAQRPIGPLVDALRAMGAEIAYLKKEGYPPLQVNGQALKGGSIRLTQNLSSQFITALLLIAPSCLSELELILPENQVSRPYIDMTIELMRKAGVNVDVEENNIRVLPQEYSASMFDVEGDWTGASYFYAIFALGSWSQMRIRSLSEESLQGDSILAPMMEAFGVVTTFDDEGALLKKGAVSSHMKIDFTACPDLAQTIIVLAAVLGIKGHFTGLGTLRIKETDRIKALEKELGKYGVEISAGQSEIRLKSGIKDRGVKQISTYDDHRMAMAFAPLALATDGVTFDDASVVSKSFPDFWRQLERLQFFVSKT